MSNTDNVRSVMTDYPHNWHDEDFDDWLNELKREAWADAKKNPADFIAAVETELNGIFISNEGNRLEPEDADVLVTTVRSRDLTAEDAQMLASYYANVASEKRKNPPVDQKQVDALAQILDEKIISHEMPGDIARRLIATGRVTVTVND